MVYLILLTTFIDCSYFYTTAIGTKLRSTYIEDAFFMNRITSVVNYRQPEHMMLN